MSENLTEETETGAECREVRTEDELVESWRFEVLLRAGYPPTLANALARERAADLHLAARLLENGCEPELAAAIVL